MNYDLVLSDFDGTLLNGHDTISARTVKAIKNFTEAGGIFGVSSGRSYAALWQRLGELGLKGEFPVMCCQGALTRSSENGEIINRIPMEKDSALEFLRRAEELDVMCQFYTADNVYTPSLNEINRFYFEINRIVPQAVGRVSEFAAKCNEPILKVLVMIDPADREKMLSTFAGIKGTKVFASHAMLVEAVSENAGKGNGLISTCKRLNIPVERSAAVGDELNDIEMIKAAGLGVAMANAVPEAKAAADYITDDYNADGVAVLLEKITANEI